MSVPQIHTGPIISKLTTLLNHSSPRRRAEQGETAQRAQRVERGDSFEKRETHEVNAQDSAHLRRVAAQKRQAPPTPTLPPVTGDRLAPTPGLNPTITGVVPSASTPLTPAQVVPPVVGDTLAPTPGFDPTTSGIIPSSPTAPIAPTSPTPALPPVVGDQLAPTPELDKGSKELEPSSGESEHHTSDSINHGHGSDESGGGGRVHGLGHGHGSGHESGNDSVGHGRGRGRGRGRGHGSSGAIDGLQQPNQTYTKEDLDKLLSAFGRKSGEKGFASGLDLNSDGLINASDLATLLSRFDSSQPTKLTPGQKLQGLLDVFGQHVKSEGPNGVYDTNGDGVINASDLADFLTRVSRQPSADEPQQPSAKVSIKSILDAFNSTAGQPGYVASLDLNGDGRIDATDLATRLTREGS